MIRIALLSLLSLSVATAAGPYDSASVALSEGFPAIALQKLVSAYPTILKGGADAKATLLYADALLQAGDAPAALELLVRDAKRLGNEGLFLKAQSLATLGRWGEALVAYRSCAAAKPSDRTRQAQIGAARMVNNLGDSPAALAILREAADWPEGPEKRIALFDAAEIELAKGEPTLARARLDNLTPVTEEEKSRHAFLMAQFSLRAKDGVSAMKWFSQVNARGPAEAVAGTTGRAQALVLSGDLPAAEVLLEAFITSHPHAPGLEQVFSILDLVYARQGESLGELPRWSSMQEDSLRQRLARFYMALAETQDRMPSRSLRLIEEAAPDGKSNPVVTEAVLEGDQGQITQEQAAEILRLLPHAEQSPRADYLRGLALAARGKLSEAATAFLYAARDGGLAEVALFNASLAELPTRSGSEGAFHVLQNKFPSSDWIPIYRLQAAFQDARRANVNGSNALRQLAQSNSSAVSQSARIALAELRYEQGDLAGASQELQRISTNATDPARHAALEVFLSDTGETSAQAGTIAAARTFLSTYPSSESEADVRMKLGEILYRKGDYAAARVELESLARKFPKSGLHEIALFLAGQATARLLISDAPSQAMALFEEVASLKGTLAQKARFEQAVLQSAQGHRKEAILILDGILASKPDTEMQILSRIEKGKTLYAENNPATYKAAIAEWKSVVEDPSTFAPWRNEALTRMGAAYEKLGNVEAAIATYYDVLKNPQVKEPEYFWFYKAGFSAARVLEAQSSWSEAIGIYEQIAAVKGPRAEEARARVNKIRLENFLWDEAS